MAFPTSPSDGDTYVVGSVTFTYNAATNVWVRSGGGSVAIQGTQGTTGEQGTQGTQGLTGQGLQGQAGSTQGAQGNQGIGGGGVPIGQEGEVLYNK